MMSQVWLILRDYLQAQHGSVMHVEFVATIITRKVEVAVAMRVCGSMTSARWNKDAGTDVPADPLDLSLQTSKINCSQFGDSSHRASGRLERYVVVEIVLIRST